MFTGQEKRVIAYVFGEERTRHYTAEQLGIKKRTVDWHLMNVYDKLQVSDEIAATRRLIQKGIVSI